MALFRKSASLREEAPASRDRSYQAEMADDLASTVEHVLSTRYARASMMEQRETRPHPAVQEITSESLLTELAAAKRSRPAEPCVGESKTPPRSGSPALRLLAFVGLAIIGYALLMKSPWRDQVPSLERMTQLLNWFAGS
jgi:hypothetical protein